MSREWRRWWRAILPTRGAWAQLVVAPSSYLLLLSLVLTMAGKLPLVRGYRYVDLWFSRWLLACAQDIAFFLGLAALLAILERSWRWLAAMTIPIAVVVAATAVINAGYMSISGEQLTWQVLSLGIDRFGDVLDIASATLLASPFLFLAAVAVVIAPPLVLRWFLVRTGRSIDEPGVTLGRAKAALVPTLVAGALALVIPEPRDYALARTHTNAVLRTYAGMLTRGGSLSDTQSGFFAGYKPYALVDRAGIDAICASKRPNIVLVVLESVRRDETSLASAGARAKTPNLVALAARGYEITQARTVITQTTKSLWSMLCGRLPLMQTRNFETSGLVDAQCLPDLLAAAGYRTGFFQSAKGSFDDRPRLVNALGFQSFLASDHITGEIVGYLASDDETLLAPFTAWIDQVGEVPFMATVLTSSTHHPYELSSNRRRKLEAAHVVLDTDRDRYDRAIEVQDALVGSILTALEERGLIDNTIVVVLGDHGEGFGDTGVKQHSSNFYEEALRVPWVMAGPHVPRGTRDSATSLVDLTPTLLELLGVALTAEAAAATPGRSVLAEQPADRVLLFACYYDRACLGFVVGRTKVVHIPETGQSFAFDLDSDPEERDPKPLTAEQRASLESVQAIAAAHRASRWLMRKDAMTRYPTWNCAAGKACSPIGRVEKR